MHELGSALLAALDGDALRELAERLRPYLREEDPGRLLDARGASERLGLHPETLSRMARTGRVWAIKAGREWRFRPDRLGIRPVGNPGRRRSHLTSRPVDGEAAAAIRGRS